MSNCSHCYGTGICADPFHQQFDLSDLIFTEECPQGCGANKGPPGDCTHCDGTGEE